MIAALLGFDAGVWVGVLLGRLALRRVTRTASRDSASSPSVAALPRPVTR